MPLLPSPRGIRQAIRLVKSETSNVSIFLAPAEPLVKDVSDQLARIEKLVSFPLGKAPSVDEVRKVNEAVGKVMDEIENKAPVK